MQQPGAPPDEWEPRRDGALRRVFDKLDALDDDMTQLQADIRKDLENYVSHKGLQVSIIALLALIATLVGFMLAPTRDAVARIERLEGSVSSKMKRVDARLEKQDAKQDAIWGVVGEGRTRAAAKAELERRTTETEE